MGDRRHEVFHILKVISRNLHKTNDTVARVIADTAADRARADELLRDPEIAGTPPMAPDVGPVEGLLVSLHQAVLNLQELHTLCRRLIDERETLARELESIGRDLVNVGIAPRTCNLGRSSRGRERMARAALGSTRRVS